MKILAAITIAAGCSAGGSTPYDYANSKGAAIYQATCQVCHGETGEGGLGPASRDTALSIDELTSAISARMPANAPGQCMGDCADETGEFIKNGLTTNALRCDAVGPAPRRLRLLTRREYKATIHDLFGDGVPVMTCSRQTDCVYRDTCTAGSCEATACDAQTFVYDPQGQTLTSVHVAGDFNNWPQTIAAGGLALTFANGLWTGTFSLGAGNHQYKLVLNESQWVTDPRSPATAADGFGGKNSVVNLTCPGPAASADITAGIPVETRPAGFPFDTDASSALVTSAHVDAYLAAAETVASYAAANPATLTPCDWTHDRASCSQTLLGDLGQRIFRRPLTSAELARFGTLVANGKDASDGVATLLEAMLVSPAFLYRSELGTKDDSGHYKLTPYEIATALAYTFWGTTPDAQLLADAASGGFDAAGIEREARRLIADPRARTQIGEMALQWIGGRDITTAGKNDATFTDAVRASLADETRNFAADVVFDGSGTFDDLIAGNYTVVDATAAAFYGLSGTGRVPYADGRRAGVLGHASMLATTAHSDQTSPIERGLLIRRNLLCEELPPPPPFGGGLPMVDPNATTRERFAMHSAAPACNSCHQYIDNVGFGLESFDEVGRWRSTENGMPVDAAGDMNDVERLGTSTSAPFTSVPELARMIVSSQAAPSCFVRQYLRFSRGLHETLAERCGRLWIADKLAAAGNDVREMMVQSVLSPDFMERR